MAIRFRHCSSEHSGRPSEIRSRFSGGYRLQGLPALSNHWEHVMQTGDVSRALLRRFDLMTEFVGVNRRRHGGLDTDRVLQNAVTGISLASQPG